MWLDLHTLQSVARSYPLQLCQLILVQTIQCIRNSVILSLVPTQVDDALSRSVDRLSQVLRGARAIALKMRHRVFHVIAKVRPVSVHSCYSLHIACLAFPSSPLFSVMVHSSCHSAQLFHSSTRVVHSGLHLSQCSQTNSDNCLFPFFCYAPPTSGRIQQLWCYLWRIAVEAECGVHGQ